jgi:hypothetical protein
MLGSLEDPVLRALEENTVHQLVPYEELALIPPDPAFTWVPGLRKMNLNRWLEEIDALQGAARRAKATEAVNEISKHIDAHLPYFGDDRMGGYPFPFGSAKVEERSLAYLRCIAAGILDYADKDSVPTMDGNPFDTDPDIVPPKPDVGGSYPTYRGIDSFPVVTEQWQRYRFEPSEAGSVTISVTHYLELWNMTNQRISGEIAAAYEINAKVIVGFNSEFDLMKEAATAASGAPSRENLKWDQGKNLPGLWHAPIRIESPSAPMSPALVEGGVVAPQRPLEPNEIRVISFRPVKMKLRLGSSGSVNSLDISGKDTSRSDFRSRYRLAFKPTGSLEFSLVDQPLRGIERLVRTVTASGERVQQFNLTHPGMSYALARKFANNVGDPRGSFFINYVQDVVTYLDRDAGKGGTSPWARNFRFNVSDDGKPANDQFFKEARVNLWPDG